MFDIRRDGDVAGGPAQAPVETTLPVDGGDVIGGPAQKPMEDLSSSGVTPDLGGETTGEGTDVMPFDAIGDIPPPPIPAPPVTTGSGVAGLRGTDAGTFSRPGTRGAAPFRSNAFQPQRPRFGPGVPIVGGDSAGVDGLGNPDEVAELLRQLAAGRQ